MSFLAELRRRNVFRVAVLYLVAAWLILQVADLLGPVLALPDWSIRLVLLLLLLGFPLTLIFSWVYELTPEGLKLEKTIDRTASITPVTGRRIDVLIVLLLVLAIAAVVADRLIPEWGPASPAFESVAVLPFVNMSGDEENEYFSDGLSEELLNLLAQIPELHVAARTSAFSFKGKEVTIPEVAAALNVNHVLEGSVRRSGDRVRITAQLIEAANGHHLWSKSYDRTLGDIFAVQDEIAAAVVAELELNLLGAHTPEARPTDPQAYALYLRGNHFRDRRAEADLERAIGYYQRALELDEDYAPAWAGLARAYANQADYGQRPIDASYEQARAAAKRALAIDPRLAAGHAAMGWIHTFYDWDWAAADEAFQRALALAPNDALVLRSSGSVARTLGHWDESIALRRQAVARDPLQASGYQSLAISLMYAGRLDEAEDAVRQASELKADQPGVHYVLAVIALQRGEAKAALAAMDMERSELWRLVGFPLVYHALGRQDDSDAALAELEARHAGDGAYQIAQAHAFRGERDPAFSWLERAHAQRDSGLTQIKGDPLLAGLEGDPRHAAFLEKMNLPVD